LIDGRRAYVDILDCYLQRNLVKNGGWLDEVNFLIHTKDKEDVAWVEKLISQHPEFTASYVATWEWAQIWKTHMSRSDTIYIKLDDDVVSTNSQNTPLSLEKPTAKLSSSYGSRIHQSLMSSQPSSPTHPPSLSPPTQSILQKETGFTTTPTQYIPSCLLPSTQA